MLFVLEPYRRRFKDAVAFDEHAIMPVDEYIGDGRVLEQRLERSEAEQFVEDVVDELSPFAVI